MRVFSLKGILAYRHAVKQARLAKVIVPKIEEEKKKIEFVCAHYTVMGLSFIIKLKDGTMVQKKVCEATTKAVAEMFASLGE